MEGRGVIPEVSESTIQFIGSTILTEAKKARRWSLSSSFNSMMMGYSMRSPQIKTQLFRLVDVLPSLRSDEQAARHIVEYLGDPTMPLGIRMLASGARHFPRVASAAMRFAVRQMSRNFIAGEDAHEAHQTFKSLRERGVGVSFDILGEAVVSEAEAQAFHKKYLDLFHYVSMARAIDEHLEMTIGFGDPYAKHDFFGRIPDYNVSIKLSSLYSMLDPIAPEASYEGVAPRLRELARIAVKNGAFLNVDMEDYRLKSLTLYIFKRLLSEDEFKKYPHFGIVLQAYLRDSEKDLADLTSFAQSRGTPFQIRLVKGAYWEYEVANAAQHGCQPPVFMSKNDTDANYERLAGRLICSFPILKPAFGTHNVRSIAYILAVIERMGIAKNDVEFQGLFGMADEIKELLAKHGWRVRSYMPVGDVLPGMAYLVRRLLENTSNESFLRQGFVEGKSPEELLRNPRSK